MFDFYLCCDRAFTLDVGAFVDSLPPAWKGGEAVVLRWPQPMVLARRPALAPPTAPVRTLAIGVGPPGFDAPSAVCLNLSCLVFSELIGSVSLCLLLNLRNFHS